MYCVGPHALPVTAYYCQRMKKKKEEKRKRERERVKTKNKTKKKFDYLKKIC